MSSHGDKIVSKLHHLREILHIGCMLNNGRGRELSAAELFALDHVETMLHDPTVPVYYLSDAVLDMAMSKSARDSVGALIEMKLASRLPFPRMIIEHPTTVDDMTIFLLLRECDDTIKVTDGKVKILNLGDSFTNSAGIILPHTVKASFSSVIVMMKKDEAQVSMPFLTDTTGRLGPYLLTSPVGLIDPEQEEITTIAMHLVKVAIKALLLALATDGVSRDVVEPPKKLNAAREKRGKPAVPTVTVLHLSHYQDREGKRHSIGSTGRHVRLHLRAGHIRNQIIGPRDNRDHKKIFINPTIVNYHPDHQAAPPIRDVRP